MGHRLREALAIQTEVAVEIADCPGLAEVLDPMRDHPVPGHRAEPRQRRRVSVDRRDQRAVGGQLAEQRFHMRARLRIAARPVPLRRGPAGVEPVRRGHRQNPHVAPVLADHPRRRDGFVGHRALIGDDHRAVRPRLAQPVAAVDGALHEGVVMALAGLLERLGGEPQVDRAAGLVAQPCALVGVAAAVLVSIALQVVEGPFHDHRQLVGKGGLEGREPVLAHADERRADRLVRAALGGERDARGRADDHEARVLVAGVVQRIEPARDEGVVDRADGDHPLAEQAVRQPRRAKQQEEVHLGDAKLEVLPFGGEVPLGGRGDAVLDEGITLRRAGKELAPVDPWAKPRGAGHVGRGGHDPRRQIAVTARQIVEDLAKGHLRRDLAAGVHRDGRDGQAGIGIAPRAAREEGHAGEELLQRRGILHRGEGLPFLTLGDAHMRLPFGHLRLGHQPAVVVLVPGDGRAPALDRIGEETHGAVVVHGGKGLGHGGHAVAAEVLHQRRQLGIAAPLEERGDIALIAQILHQPLAPDRAAAVGECRVFGVGAGVDPVAQPRAAGLVEGIALQGAVFHPHHVPAEGLEDLLDPPEEPLAHDAVERLAVVVDHPPAVAQVVLPALLQHLVDIAFVKLGVADKRDHPAGIDLGPPVLGADEVLHHRGQRGDADAKPDRAGGEIHIVDVLGAARVALHAAVAAKILHLLARLVAHQVLHGVEDRRGVGLDRHPVLGAQRREVERRHDRHHRGRGGLMPADLDAVLLGPEMIGVVDHPVRQPKQSLLDHLEVLRVVGHVVPPFPRERI